MNASLIQLFIIANAVLIGVVATIAWRHAMAHFRPKQETESKTARPTMKLPPAVQEQMLEVAENKYQKIIESAANELQLDLSKTKTLLNNELATLGASAPVWSAMRGLRWPPCCR